MSRKLSRQDENAVISAVGQVCDLYRVKVFRQQSRVFTVPGAAGRERPFFVGQWTDDLGQKHYAGMADLLARPRIWAPSLLPICLSETAAWLDTQGFRVAVPLWIECKSGKNGPTFDQLAFKAHVEANGEHWLLIHDDVRPLMEWFAAHGIAEGGR